MPLEHRGASEVHACTQPRHEFLNMPASTPLNETIAECLTQAQSESVESQANALKTLSSLTRVNSHNRHLVAQAPEAIPTILTFSRSPSPQVQTLALSILFNLSLNPNLKPSLVHPDTISHLNSIVLSPPSPPAGKLAASLICSLAMLDKNKAVFGVCGTVEALVKALGDSSDASATAYHHILSSLVELVQFHGNCTLAVRAGAVPVLVRILNGPAEDLGGTCLVILGLLARFEEGIGAIRSVDGVVGLLVDGLRRGCMASRESAAEILIRLFERSEELMAAAVEGPDFCSLLADLSIRGSIKAREKAGVLMKMLMEANIDCYLDESLSILR